jgi:hypothetical protein
LKFFRDTCAHPTDEMMLVAADEQRQEREHDQAALQYRKSIPADVTPTNVRLTVRASARAMRTLTSGCARHWWA